MKKKILIVDDEKNLTEILALRLETNGYEVIIAYNGRDGLEKTEKENPDLILLDIMMPDMDGIDVLRRLKNNPKAGHIPVIMLTCKGESSSLLKAENLGATDYFIKPFESEELLRAIKKYI